MIKEFHYKNFSHTTSYNIFNCHPQLKLKQAKNIIDDFQAPPDKSSKK